MSDRAEEFDGIQDEEVQRLIAEFKSGNERAWQRLVEILKRNIVAANNAQASDPEWRATRRVYIEEAVLQAVRNYDPDKGPFWPFATGYVRNVTTCPTEDSYYEKTEAASRHNVRREVRAWSNSFRLSHERYPTAAEICQANPGWQDFVYSSHYEPLVSLNAPIDNEGDGAVGEQIDYLPNRPSDEPDPLHNTVVSVLRSWHSLCIHRLRDGRSELVPVFEQRYGRYWLPVTNSLAGGMTGWPKTVDEAASELPQFSKERKLDFIIRERQMLEILVSAGLLTSMENPQALNDQEA